MIFVVSLLVIPFQNCAPVGETSADFGSGTDSINGVNGAGDTNVDGTDTGAGTDTGTGNNTGTGNEEIPPVEEVDPVRKFANDSAPVIVFSDGGLTDDNSDGLVDFIFYSGADNNRNSGTTDDDFAGITISDADGNGLNAANCDVYESSQLSSGVVTNASVVHSEVGCTIAAGTITITVGSCANLPNRLDRYSDLRVHLSVDESDAGDGVDDVYVASAELTSTNPTVVQPKSFDLVLDLDLTVANNCINESVVNPLDLDGASGGIFGSKVAIYDNYAAASSKTTSGVIGGIYIYERDNSNPSLDSFVSAPTKITIKDMVGATYYDNSANNADAFEISSLSMYNDGTNDLLAVGIEKYNNCYGVVYTYLRGTGNNWTQAEAITLSGVATGLGCGAPAAPKFGASLSLHGLKLAVGAPKFVSGVDVNSGLDIVGRVTIYDISSLGVTSNPQAKDPIDPLTSFGESVSVRDGKIIIGAPAYNQQRGRAYVYDIGTDADLNVLLNEVSLRAASQESGDLFGSAVDINAGIAVVGTAKSSGSGEAFIFSGTDYGTRVEISEGARTFGNDVAIVGDKILVADYLSDAVRYYRNPAGNQRRIIETDMTDNPNTKDYGSSIAVDRGGDLTPTLFVGAKGSSDLEGRGFFEELPAIVGDETEGI